MKLLHIKIHIKLEHIYIYIYIYICMYIHVYNWYKTGLRRCGAQLGTFILGVTVMGQE